MKNRVFNLLTVLAIVAVVFINLKVVNKSTKNGYLKPEIKKVLAESSGGSGSSGSGGSGSSSSTPPEGKVCGPDECEMKVGPITYYGKYYHCKWALEGSCNFLSCFKSCDALF